MSLKTRTPEQLLILLAVAASLSFSLWHALLNNFAIERASFTGAEIGILQSLREVPGFLAFTTIFVLLVLTEQSFALIAIVVIGFGVAITGYLPSEYGLYFTTVLMSVGFHYFYTLQQSLTLQWISKDRSPIVMGWMSSASSIAALVAFASIWLGIEWLSIDYQWLYLIAGGFTILVAGWALYWFPWFPQETVQHKHLVLRKRYWLYYALVFMSGARRQIFIVFAGFLMVEKFGFSASNIALLYLFNHGINAVIAPRVGHLIAKWGERPALIAEYVGLIGIFLAYAIVESAAVAASLYIVIAAVVIPAIFGFIWLTSSSAVFVAGAMMAAVSLVLALFVPKAPSRGDEVSWELLGFAKSDN